MPNLLMRSKLFVPGARTELFDKAFAGEADALSFDLEDSVRPERKAEARASVAGMLDGLGARRGGKLVIVRSNSPGSVWFADDLKAVVRPGLDWINLPKAENAAEVRAAVSAIEEAEQANGVTRPVRLLITIESASGLRHAAEIAISHPRVVGLQLGLADLFEPLGIDRGDADNVHAALFALRMAAGEAGVLCCDAAYANLLDLAGFEAEARMAMRLGFVGKSCVHPSQVAIANRVFSVAPEVLAAARRVLAVAAGEGDRGAFVVDGRMIDAPFLQRAQAIVAAADASSESNPSAA